MAKKPVSRDQKLAALEAQNQELQRRLEEAEEALNAITAGQVDALVVYGEKDEQIFTLEGADSTYRLMIENIHEGAANITANGTILYCNRRLAEMLALPLELVFGSSFYNYLMPSDYNAFTTLIHQGIEGFSKGELFLTCNGEANLPVLITASVTLVNQQQGVCLVITDLTEQKESAAREKVLRLQLMEQREDERMRIARNLHDGPLQDVIGLSFMLHELVSCASEKSAEIQAMQESVLRLASDLRNVCNELRPPASIRFGLAKAIRYQVEELQHKYSDIAFRLDLAEDGESIPETVRTALFRIFQESINNILRHAWATTIEIRLLVDPNSVLMEVQDNGKGFLLPEDWTELSKAGHLGLVGMRERAVAVGGQLEVISWSNQGTTVRVEVPGRLQHL